MRGSRLRYDKERCYYHLMNRVAGEPGVYPFGDTEKEKLFQLAGDLSRFYSIGKTGTGFLLRAHVDDPGMAC